MKELRLKKMNLIHWSLHCRQEGDIPLHGPENLRKMKDKKKKKRRENTEANESTSMSLVQKLPEKL